MNQNISISISKRLLKNIEDNIEGNDRSEKIIKCVEIGYHYLTHHRVQCLYCDHVFEVPIPKLDKIEKPEKLDLHIHCPVCLLPFEPFEVKQGSKKT